ncbi:MAG: hypothetical protein NTW21_00075 [Verrucomicrobia bacterium]|nr:hypothetical protein [Verrucomicrobiota bacterium]
MTVDAHARPMPILHRTAAASSASTLTERRYKAPHARHMPILHRAAAASFASTLTERRYKAAHARPMRGFQIQSHATTLSHQ